ncbi:MAG: glycosyltransferase [Candidatus Nanopelagicaceae bacterium]
MINFIVPSVGRKTLTNTLNSLVNQNNKEWQAWVGLDGICESEFDKSILLDDSRIHYVFIKDRLGDFDHNPVVERPTGNAGKVRNYLISLIDNEYDWIGFVDDDDTLRETYIDKLIEEIEYTSFDCCIFRMIHDDKKNNTTVIVPPYGMNQVVQNFVGISFCVSKSFLNRTGVKFTSSSFEDYTMLESIHNANGEIYMSEHLVYDVRPAGD